ncbi:hypothetical protein VULLAG_LOCUS15886 [Vulpes lagopus]
MFAACQAFPGSGEGPASKERRAINQTRGILEICVTPWAAAEPATPPATLTLAFSIPAQGPLLTTQPAHFVAQTGLSPLVHLVAP